MAKKTIEQYFCDICGKQADVINVNYPVIFHTEQDEGRSVKPYISQEKLDMCQECLLKTLAIDGSGAQGANKYTLRNLKKGGE